MVNELMFVSVIVPVYNGEAFISEAIQSIFSQNYSRLEVIVVDDGSTDNTKSVVLSFGERVTYAYQENRGPASARNTGFQKAKGDIIGFLDADDIWTDGRLTLLLNRLKDEPSPHVVLGHVRVETLRDSEYVPQNLLKPHIIPLFGAGLFKRSVFEEVGLLDPSLRFSEDQDWFLRAKEKGIPIVVLKEVTLIRRKHAKSMTKGAGWKDVDIIRVLKKSLDRRRNEGKGEAKELPKLSDYKERGAI